MTSEAGGLFADVGNHRIEDHNLARSYFGRLERTWTTPATAAMAQRLMYGSDWL